MSQILSETAVRYGSRNSVTVHAGGGLKYLAPFLRRGINPSRLFFFPHPLVNLFARISVSAQPHFGGSRAANLRALTEREARLVGVDPRGVLAVWNQVRFSRK